MKRKRTIEDVLLHLKRRANIVCFFAAVGIILVFFVPLDSTLVTLSDCILTSLLLFNIVDIARISKDVDDDQKYSLRLQFVENIVFLVIIATRVLERVYYLIRGI